MNEQLQNKCQLMADNYLVVSKSAKLDFQVAAALGALVYTAQNQQAVESEIRENRALLKSKVSAFSHMRGYTNIALLSKMSLADDAENYLDRVLDAYHAIVEGRILRSEFLTHAAAAMADYVDPADYADVIDRAGAIFDNMQKQHPLLTNDEDMTLCVLMAISGMDATAIMDESERCYNALKDNGFLLNKDALQSISIILALSDKSTEEKCQRYIEIREALKESGSKLSGDSLPIIAAFATLDAPIDEIVTAVSEADEFLKHQKGFGGILGVGAQMRRLLASALVLQTYQENSLGERITSAVTTTIVELTVIAIVTIIIMTSIIASNTTINN